MRNSAEATITTTKTESLVQRIPLCPCDGGCPRCTSVVQPKLKIGAPNDKYEREADRIADQVMAMPETATGSKPSTDAASGEIGSSQYLG